MSYEFFLLNLIKVGVGGFVVNDNDEILVIQEKYSLQRQWKLPGGSNNLNIDQIINSTDEFLI